MGLRKRSGPRAGPLLTPWHNLDRFVRGLLGVKLYTKYQRPRLLV